METIKAGAGAERAERASECRQHRHIIFAGGGEVRVNPATGQSSIAMPPRNRPQIEPRYPVAGLKVFQGSFGIAFEFVCPDCLDESDCIDIQCRAGWDDHGYGFGNLEIGILPDGSHRATWSCGGCCD